MGDNMRVASDRHAGISACAGKSEGAKRLYLEKLLTLANILTDNKQN